MANNNKHGFTDEAAVKDLFDIDNYVKGLSKFIMTCDTPMTISIQGSWGTGKTSFMNLIKEKLQKKENESYTFPVDFNTWQFSNLIWKISLLSRCFPA